MEGGVAVRRGRGAEVGDGRGLRRAGEGDSGAAEVGRRLTGPAGRSAMARELSQAELLDFLCQAGGRVSNAALLGHFRGFLRDPAAPAEELRGRRELFKGFVNSVASVRQEGGAKFVVLRKRFRQLVADEPPARPDPDGDPDGDGERAQAGTAPQAPPDGAAPQQSRGRAGGAAGAEEEGRPRSRTCSAGSAPALGGARPPPPNGDPPAAFSPAPPGPVGASTAPPGGGGLQQRIHEWVAASHRLSWQRPDGDGAASDEASWPGRPSPPGSACGACPWPLADDSRREREDSRWGREDPRRELPPVFRSIRCQLALQDLDEGLEQESPASEDGSSASGGSDSCRGEGQQPRLPTPPPPGGQNGCPRNPVGTSWTRGEGLPCQPQANGLVGPSRGAPIPGPFPPLGQIPQRSFSKDRPLDPDSKKPNGPVSKAKKVAQWPSPNLDAPQSPQLAHRQGSLGSTPSAEGPGPDTDGSPEHRSSLVPLEPREHAWLVKVAAGSWLQARALFLEDPLLATRKDFISGYTVLHWLAKHGNAQVLLDFVTGARKAGVDVDVDVKSGCGYTPLHLAAMHGHQLVIRVLVQTLQCQVQVRDSSGKRPWQYLSSSTSGEIWQLLGAPKGKTIFPAHPITRNASSALRGKSPELARKISRKTSLAAYLKPQHIKWKMANKYPALQEKEEYSD